jgi:hypothetical protein
MSNKNENEAVPQIVFPEGQDPVIRYNISLDSAKRTESGDWEVVRTVKQVVSFDENYWFVREKAIKSIDKTFEKANTTTHKAISAILTDYKDDFFSKSEWDGSQYVLSSPNKDDVLVEENHGIVEDVENT